MHKFDKFVCVLTTKRQHSNSFGLVKECSHIPCVSASSVFNSDLMQLSDCLSDTRCGYFDLVDLNVVTLI